MIEKEWRKMSAPPPGFAQSMNLNPFRAHLLYNRGIRDPEQVELYLESDSRLLNDPTMLPDMAQAVERLKRAIERNATQCHASNTNTHAQNKTHAQNTQTHKTHKTYSTKRTHTTHQGCP